MRTQVILNAENGLIDLDGLTHLPSAPPAPLNATGLVRVFLEPTLVISTGIHSGPVIMDIEVFESAPDEDGAVEWEDVVEFTAAHTPGAVVALHGAYEVPPEGASVTLPGDPSTVRLRVSATGRDIDYDLSVDESSERYLVQIWPAPDSDQRVIASISTNSRRPTRLEPFPPNSVTTGSVLGHHRSRP